jgi:hypothetical protein
MEFVSVLRRSTIDLVGTGEEFIESWDGDYDGV